MYPSLLLGELSRAELLNHRAEPSRAFKFTKPSLNEPILKKKKICIDLENDSILLHKSPKYCLIFKIQVSLESWWKYTYQYCVGTLVHSAPKVPPHCRAPEDNCLNFTDKSIIYQNVVMLLKSLDMTLLLNLLY